jgi:hypothetical protein
MKTARTARAAGAVQAVVIKRLGANLLLRRLLRIIRRRRRRGRALGRLAAVGSIRCSGRRILIRRCTRWRRSVLFSSRSRRRRIGSLIRACGFLLRAGRQHQRRHYCAKCKFGVHRSVPQREARVVLKRLRPDKVVPTPRFPQARRANSIEVPVRLETAGAGRRAAVEPGRRNGATDG